MPPNVPGRTFRPLKHHKPTQTKTGTPSTTAIDVFNAGSIPGEIADDLNAAIKYTKKTAKEISLSVCQVPGESKVHTSSFAHGNRCGVDVKACSKAYGDRAVKVMDFHTHPVQDPVTIGILPSDTDFVGNLGESFDSGVRQISCVSSGHSKHIHCYAPKEEAMTAQKVNEYEKALARTKSYYEVDPYIRNNIGKDFNHEWYDRKSFKKVDATDKQIVEDSIGKAAKGLRQRDLSDLVEKGLFCDYLQNKTKPQDNGVGLECRKFLRKKITDVIFK